MILCHSLCSGESFWLVSLIFSAEEELDFGDFSFRGEAMKPSRLTRGFLSLDENSYSNSVFFVVAVVVFWFSIVFNFFGLFQIVFLKLDC